MTLSYRMFDESTEGGTTGVATPPESAPTTPAPDTSASSGDPVLHTTESTETPGDTTAPASAAPTPGQTPPPATPSQEHATFLQRLRDKYQVDLSTKYKSDEEAERGLLNAMKMVGARDEYAEIGRYYAQNHDDFRKYMEQQNAPAAPADGTAEPGWWAPPEWNESWNQYIDSNSPTGFKEETPLEVRQKAQQRADYFGRWQHGLVYDPEKTLKPLFDKWSQQINQNFHAASQQQAEQQRLSFEADQLRDSHAHWIYQQAQDGRFITDPSGKRLFSTAGSVFMDHLFKLNATGMRDQKAMFDAATALTQRDMAAMGVGPYAQAAQQASPPVQTPNSNAGRTPNGQRAVKPQGGTLREMLMREAEHMPDKEFQFQ